MKFRVFHVLIIGLAALGATAPARAADSPAPPVEVSRIAFGSCAQQSKAQPIWDRIADTRPDLFVLLGDNVYGDTEDMGVLKSKYEAFAGIAEFASFRSLFPLIATWDDHDYGVDDGGVEYRMKAESKEVMLDFFGDPANSLRRQRPGVYESYVYGSPGRRVQVILLDTRWFRSPLKRDAVGYVADPDPSKTMLGDEQWAWLETQLRMPAELRIIGTSIQFVSEDHPYEKWANFPLERQRMMDLLEKTGATRTLMISGDRHFADLSCVPTPWGSPLCDLTASGLNRAKPGAELETNRYRVAGYNQGNHFGLIEIDWSSGAPRLSESIVDETGKTAFKVEQTID